MSSTQDSATECDKLVHRISMKFDPEYRLREMEGKNVGKSTSFEDLKAIALSARAKGLISAPGDDKRIFKV